MEELKKLDSAQTRKERITFVPQEEFSAFDDKGEVFLDEEDKLSFEDSGVGGIVRQVYLSNLAGKIQDNEIEYIVVQPLNNFKSQMIDLFNLGYCIENDLDSFFKIYEKGKEEYKTEDLVNFKSKGEFETYRFYSECVFHVNLLLDKQINEKFNLSVVLRTMNIKRRVFNIENKEVEVKSVKTLKILMKDFLNLGNDCGGILYQDDCFEHVIRDSRVKRL